VGHPVVAGHRRRWRGPRASPSAAASTAARQCQQRSAGDVGDGTFRRFVSDATNLVAGGDNGVSDVFLRDRDTDADGVFDEADAVSTVRVSERDGIGGNGASDQPAISADGRVVVFTSLAGSLFGAGPPRLGLPAVLRWDRLTRQTGLVSQTTEGVLLASARCVQPDVWSVGEVPFAAGGGWPATPVPVPD
jgi:hypothetical protein